jgi:lipopolysaccharide export system permease protein
VKEGGIEPMYGMWLATVVLIPVGAFLTYKSTTDSVLFDKEWYGKLMSKFKKS